MSGRTSHLVPADIDGDRDIDLVFTSTSSEANLGWLENANGLGEFGSAKMINADLDSVSSLFAADIDGDGDTDLLMGSDSDATVVWLENTDGKGRFDAQHTLLEEADQAGNVFAADVDGDGDPDVFAEYRNSDSFVQKKSVVWFQNVSELTALGFEIPPEQGQGIFLRAEVVSDSVLGNSDILAVDFDNDGGRDILVASSSDVFGDSLALFRNRFPQQQKSFDGSIRFAEPILIPFSASDEISMASGDIDGDGDSDVVTVSSNDGEIKSYENRIRNVGDADANGAVDFADFLVLAANFGRAIDTLWAGGDFDLDGRVSFVDFLLLAANYQGTVAT